MSLRSLEAQKYYTDVTEYIEYLCGGPKEVSQIVQHFDHFKCALLMADVSVLCRTAGKSHRVAALVIWTTWMQALMDITANEKKH